MESTFLPQAGSNGNTRDTLASLGHRLREYSTFLTVGSFLKNIFFKNEINDNKEDSSIPNHTLSKNIYFEQIVRYFSRSCRVWQTLPSYTKSNVKTAQVRTPVSAPATLNTDTRRPVSSYRAGPLKLNSLIQSHIMLLLHLRLSTLSVPSRRQCHLAIRYGGEQRPVTTTCPSLWSCGKITPTFLINVLKKNPTAICGPSLGTWYLLMTLARSLQSPTTWQYWRSD